MADDIDDLLDEVEEKYVKKSSVYSNHDGASLSKKWTNKRRTKMREEDDLDAVIDDIIGDSDIPDDPPPCRKERSCPDSSSSSQHSSSFRKSIHKRCNPAYLGGSAIMAGVSSAMTERSCDQLRCTSCDFKVVSYDNLQWDSSCDYLFFRNNVPDYQRLCAKLKKRKGCRAYACQCSWRSVTNLTDIVDEDLKWVCGKHPT